MESDNSLELELKKVSQELSSHKIELHQTREYLQCILQNSNNMIFATDVDGMIVSFSKGGEKILGYTWDELAGYFLDTFAEDPDAFEEFLADTQEKGAAVRLEFPFKHKDGHTVYCDVSMINLTNTKGQRVGTVGVSRDITRWKTLQDDLVRIDRLAEIGRVAEGIAQEINTPLAVINETAGRAEVIVKDAKGLSPKQNREVPPLKYDYVYRLEQERPDLAIVLNGGVKTLEQIDTHLAHVDGVMLGREAYHNPFILATVDQRYYDSSEAPREREEVIADLMDYAALEMQRGARLHDIARHIHGLYLGVPGARAWRRKLSTEAHAADAGSELLSFG